MEPKALRLPIIALAVLGVLDVGCASTRARSDVGVDLVRGRQTVVELVLAANATTPDRLLVHLSHTCNLTIDGAPYPVVDLQELVPSATSPRGINAILVFAPTGTLLRRIEYTSERPLFCLDHRLYVWGDLRIDGVPSAGNEVSFGAEGKSLSLRHVEAKDVPARRARLYRVQ